jgi:myo-inositol 2-dehydrogenase/D-chiro-inositol 1-dehydrogenase
MNQFITCVLEDKKPPVGGVDGKISVAMGYAAMESVITGTFVKVTP